MYNKLFSKIVDSSIWLAPDPVRLVWITFLAVMDEDGMVQLPTVANVAHRARIDMVAAEEAVRVLEAPEPSTATEDDDGRRIEKVPGGWIVLNAKKYRDMATREIQRESNRLRVARHRARAAGNADVTAGNADVTGGTQPVMQSEAYTEAERHTHDARAREPVNGYSPPQEAIHEAFLQFRERYPKFAGRQNWIAAESRYHIRLEQGETIATLAAVVERYRAYVDAGGVSSTAHVLRPDTFLSAPDEPWRQAWDLPKAKARTAADRVTWKPPDDDTNNGSVL